MRGSHTHPEKPDVTDVNKQPDHIKRQMSTTAGADGCLNPAKLFRTDSAGNTSATSASSLVGARPHNNSLPDDEATLHPSQRSNTSRLEAGTSRTGEGEGDKKFTIAKQLRIVLWKWLNLLLAFVPVGIATHYAGVNPTIVFVMNFIAIVPLAGLLSSATEEVALYCGEVIGGLVNASFGNAVELIVGILALIKHEVVIVQTSLIGSILSNLLLVLGMAFFAGGVNRPEQHFNTTVAQTAASLLTVSCASLIVPAAFHMASNKPGDAGLAQLSRGTAVILLLVYGSYLFFQLHTHVHLYNVRSKKVPTANLVRRNRNSTSTPQHSPTNSTSAEGPKPEEEGEEEEEQETPALTLWFAIGVLIASTVLVALCAECLVDSIDHLVTSAGISRVFVGLILLPIVGNAAEHATAVTVAIKDKMDLTIGVAVGSSMQIALLVIPLMVILGWILGIEGMNLYFDGFQISILFISVLLVNYLIADGKSNYLEGILLMALYLIVAYVFPNLLFLSFSFHWYTGC
jgi:Ca2+:H+ antiporter